MTFTFVFLPQLLLSCSAVLNCSSKSSLKIIVSQPSLLLLPVFTNFTFSRLSCACFGRKLDNKVKFSTRLTLLNMGLTTAGFVACWLTVGDDSDEPLQALIAMDQHKIKLFTLLGFISLSNLPSLAFLCLLWTTGCYSCLNPTTEISVHDPDQPESHIVLSAEIL